MSIGAEKMRELQSRLKAAGARMRAFARFPQEPAAFLRQKADMLRERARRWRGGDASRVAQAGAAGDAQAPLWHRLRSSWHGLRTRAAAADGAAAEAGAHDAQAPFWRRLRLPRHGPGAVPADPAAPEAGADDARAPLWRRWRLSWPAFWPRAEDGAAAEAGAREGQEPFWARLRPAPHGPWSAAAAVAADGAAVPASPEIAAPPEPRRAAARWRDRLPERRELLKAAGIAALAFLALPYALILVYRVVDPPFSALMVRQFLGGVNVRQQWVDLEDISPSLPLAVVISEDAAFCRHWGVDWRSVGEALDDAEDGRRVRGASTIPMQTAKNLFLWNGHSYVRKLLELPLAYTLSILWPKRRVLEIYLNIAEWGPGIFGAEAAARHHFRKSAAQLTPREAALLAAALPNPRRRNAGRPNGLTARVAAHIAARAGREAQDAACVLRSRQ